MEHSIRKNTIRATQQRVETGMYQNVIRIPHHGPPDVLRRPNSIRNILKFLFKPIRDWIDEVVVPLPLVFCQSRLGEKWGRTQTAKSNRFQFVT